MKFPVDENKYGRIIEMKIVILLTLTYRINAFSLHQLDKSRNAVNTIDRKNFLFYLQIVFSIFTLFIYGPNPFS